MNLWLNLNWMWMWISDENQKMVRSNGKWRPSKNWSPLSNWGRLPPPLQNPNHKSYHQLTCWWLDKDKSCSFPRFIIQSIHVYFSILYVWSHSNRENPQGGIQMLKLVQCYGRVASLTWKLILQNHSSVMSLSRSWVIWNPVDRLHCSEVYL